MGGKGSELTATLRRRVRFWLALHLDVHHLPKLALWAGGFLSLFGGLLWLLQPTGPVTPTSGTVVGLGFRETEEGSIATASVRLDHGTRRIEIPARLGCRVGDTIQLRRRPTRAGDVVTVARMPRPCRS